MLKKPLRIAWIGLIWIVAGTILSGADSGMGTLAMAIGLCIGSLALMLHFWKKTNAE